MAKYKSVNEKLHSYRSDKKSLPRRARPVNLPASPVKAGVSNNQYR